MKWMTIILLALLTAGYSAQAENAWTEEQIKAAAQSPMEITNLLQGVSNEQAEALVEQVIAQIDLLEIKLEEKKARVAFVLGLVQRTLGEQAGPVIRNVLAKINPALVPPVAVGPAPIGTLGLPRALPLAPPVAPRYPGQ